MALTLLSGLRRLNRTIAILVGVLLLACVVFVLADIVLRQMGSSLGGTDEISGYVMAIATSWGMAFTLIELGHVRIDILRGRATGGVRALFDLTAMLALAVTVTLIAVRGWPVLSRSLANSSRANTPLETPLALVQAPWLAGWIWFALVSWLTFVAALTLIARRDFAASEAAIGTFGELDALK
ncbi:TRAP transporter small permease subunit [Ruegeria sp. PrR005]|uniref:TRAP transporter small permease protein n=1 Tax=Ruegeria sp. PrR005 TaxID=2706882 RepID=A0A6B2NYW2_9RHOB|nr:TRAP transporter small permease subunit [Ruegeria sp. PrR005]NDW47877.1 TRAP transporter small permease subunit [Ruegeria sp. PrR005]